MATKTLAFEIGTEEIPAFDLDSATKQLAEMAPAAFDAARIPYERIDVLTSPRRLIVMAYGVAEQTEALAEEHKGPAAKIAFDEDGNPTKAAEGFARGKGIDVSELQRREVDGTEYVFACTNVPATPVASLLPDVLAGLIPAIKWPRSCRWASYDEYFVRPVRWIVAMLDADVLPVSFAGAQAGNQTMGHRVLAPGFHQVPTADKLPDVLRGIGVLPSQEEREQAIRAGVADIEADLGLEARLPQKTLLEVTNLSEFPQPVCGTFDEEFLQVPEEIIVDAMLMHQRYFPLYDKQGALTNRFIITSNGDPKHAAAIVDGNERVVRARLDDAKFFYEEDLKNPLESYVEKLDEVVFQEQLGTVKAKAERLRALGAHLAADAGLDAAQAEQVQRACYLCKADLVTNAVIEFTSVQGIMGSYYATASGEDEAVAHAIGQHYRPRFAGADLPDTQVGQLVALADKLDTICGLFAVGQGPTGTSDPFALRRACLGIVSMLDAGLPVSLGSAIDQALDGYAGVDFDRKAVRDQIEEFFTTRTKVLLRDAGCSADAVDAVLAAGVTEPAVVMAHTRALEQARSSSPEVMGNLATAYARANNLRDPQLGDEVDQALLTAPEQALADAIEQVQGSVSEALSADDYPQALAQLASLRAPVDRFFEEVMVMDEDQRVRENRLKLLNRFVGVFANVADFGTLAKG